MGNTVYFKIAWVRRETSEGRIPGKNESNGVIDEKESNIEKE